MKKLDKDAIILQAIEEISIARRYKQGKVANWQKNEGLYYGKKVKTDDSRANVELGRMQEFVHTLLSKIDNPLVFKYSKKKESQRKRVEYLNSFRQNQQQLDSWDIKDIVGKKQAIIYGRSIYHYAASSDKGEYKSNLENIDVYDFLIDPSAGGIDIEQAKYMGRYGVVKTRAELEQMMKDKSYDKKAIQRLLDGSGNANESSQEETNKKSRQYGQNTIGEKESNDVDKFKFWEWYTTDYKTGERMYLLLSESGKESIRTLPLTELFKSNLFPFWTWAAFPDLTEFWTPSYCDYVREIFMVQNVSINQMLDNAEAINKPQKVVNVTAIQNLAQLKYKKDGIIAVNKDIDANRAVQLLQVPSIKTPIDVFNILEGIQEKSSGVTSGAKGVSDEDAKVGIYEGNMANASDRFGLLNKSYSYAYKRFAELFRFGVIEHLTKKTAIDILGPNGVEVVMVNKRDLIYRGEEFGIIVEASNAEVISAQNNTDRKLQFLQAQQANPEINQKKNTEMQAAIVGFNEEDVKQLLDKSDFGQMEIISEAERDIEYILGGRQIKPNKNANNAYKQRIVNYLKDHEEDISMEDFNKITDYVASVDKIIIDNELRRMNSAVTAGLEAGTLPGMQEQAANPAQPVGNGLPAPMVDMGTPQTGNINGQQLV